MSPIYRFVFGILRCATKCNFHRLTQLNSSISCHIFLHQEREEQMTLDIATWNISYWNLLLRCCHFAYHRELAQLFLVIAYSWNLSKDYVFKCTWFVRVWHKFTIHSCYFEKYIVIIKAWYDLLYFKRQIFWYWNIETDRTFYHETILMMKS